MFLTEDTTQKICSVIVPNTDTTDCVMRLKESIGFSKASGKKVNDIITVLPGDKKVNTEVINIRIISVKLDSGEYEYLATNIFDKSLTPEDFKELYFKRWPIELKYLELKERLQIEDFNGATPVAIIQEFYINLLYSNLSALVKSDADKTIESKSNSGNKHRYSQIGSSNVKLRKTTNELITKTESPVSNAHLIE